MAGKGNLTLSEGQRSSPVLRCAGQHCGSTAECQEEEGAAVVGAFGCAVEWRPGFFMQAANAACLLVGCEL